MSLFKQPLAWVLLTATVLTTAPVVVMADDPLTDAIASYRTGHYEQARKTLIQLHQDSPANTRATYYLAITLAQLGKYDDARANYREVLTLAPNSPEAAMANEGLQYLPPPGQLDRPPQPATAAAAPSHNHSDNGAISAQVARQQAQQAQTAYAQQPGGISPEDMMAMQMMMGGNNNNNNNGFNPMMLMQQQGNDPNNPNRSAIDPSVMSSMMMNQMLQNFNFDSNNNNK